jgi:hypothetical protein
MSASTRYKRRRTRAIAYGRWQPWVSPAPVRAHVHHLRHQGGSYAAIGRAAGVSASTVHDIQAGKGRITAPVAAALLSLTADDLARPAIPAGGTRLRLRSLMAMGHDCARIARAAGASPAAIRKIVQGRAAEVTPQLHARIRDLWQAWWDKTPPQRTPAERAAATAARRTARRHDWCTPLALDEDVIDCVGYQPEHGWRPATGTGTAPDLPAPQTARESRKTSRSEEGNTMAFDPVPRTASEYQKGAAFGHATVMRQIDGGQPADLIQQTQDAARQTLLAAARTDGEREFCQGYAEVVDSRIATLRDIQRAERDAERQERASDSSPAAAGSDAELEAG